MCKDGNMALPIPHEKLYTVEEFEALLALPENRDRLLELINGEIYEKMPTEEHGVIVTNVVVELVPYSKKTKSGRVGTEVRHRKPDDKRNSRLPDISFNTAKRPIVTEGSVPEMPTLAVEVQSPDDSVKQMRDSAEYYLANGSLMVWLIFPKKRIVEVYTPDGEVQMLDETDMLSGGGVLPGFEMPIAAIFADPMDEAEE
jgi:Uma2 family endonuclease